MEPLAILVLVVVNVALLAVAVRSERVIVHWAALNRRGVGSAPVDSAAASPGGDRRRSSGSASSTPAEQGRVVPRADLARTLPADLVELVLRPAAFEPETDVSAPEVAGAPTASQGPAAEQAPVNDEPVVHAILEGPLAWARLIETENARLERYRRPITVVLMEVDGLRRRNGKTGDDQAARMLPDLTDALSAEGRASDWFARVGGNRFGALLPETDEIEAINYVERVRASCEPLLAATGMPLRLAIGWASPSASSDLEWALLAAEERMHADRSGRAVQGAHPAPRPAGPRLVALPDARPADDLSVPRRVRQ